MMSRLHRLPADGALTAYRYLGLAGSILLAAGALQVGARAGTAGGDGPPGPAQLPGLLACLVGLTALTVAWWRAAMGTGAPTGRWVVVTAALWALPLLVAPPLGSRDAYAYLCQGAILNAGLDPHTTTPAGLPCPWLASVPPVWRGTVSPYGPLTTFASAGAAAVADATGRVEGGVDVLRLVALVGVALAVWAGRRLAAAAGVDPARAGVLALIGPLVAVHAIGGVHIDALVTGLVLAGLAVAAGPVAGTRPGAGTRYAPYAAGLILGLAVAVKATALVAVPFAALLARRTSPPRALAATTGAAALAYAVLAVPSGLGLGFLRGLPASADLVEWTSPPTALGMTVGYALRVVGVESTTPVAVARVLGLAAAAAIVATAWWRARRGGVRTVVAAAGLAFGAVALLGPVFYAWYALTPLALLAVSTSDERARAWIGAASAPLAYLTLPNGLGLAPRTKLPGALAVTAALVATAWRALRSRPTRTGS